MGGKNQQDEGLCDFASYHIKYRQVYTNEKEIQKNKPKSNKEKMEGNTFKQLKVSQQTGS